MATARDLQAQLAQARSPEEYVDMLQHGVTHFPRTALFWRLYAEHERSLSGPAAGLAVLEGGGSSALPWCRCDPELWRVACELRRDCGRREDELGPESKALGRAFAVLSDDDRRKLYDTTGAIDDGTGASAGEGDDE